MGTSLWRQCEKISIKNIFGLWHAERVQFKSGSIVTHNVRSGLLLTQMFNISYLCWIWVKGRILQSDKQRKDSLDLQNVNGDYNEIYCPKLWHKAKIVSRKVKVQKLSHCDGIKLNGKKKKISESRGMIKVWVGKSTCCSGLNFSLILLCNSTF